MSTATLKRGVLVVISLILVLGDVPSASARLDTQPPKILKIAATDQDGNNRLDELVVTYNEPIIHKADSDGTYPFTVSGYVVTSVRAASGDKLTIVVAESGAKDIAATPAVTYARTNRQKVTDLAGNQAAAATFSATSAVDRDGDGYGSNDCAPTKPKIHPHALDVPDASFVDNNCDGIDGDIAKASFVATTGSGTTCTMQQPCGTLQQGVSTAVADGHRDVYVAAGTYANGFFQMASGVSVYGGYDADFVRGAPQSAGHEAVVQGTEDALVTAATPDKIATVTVAAIGLTKPTKLAFVTLQGADSTAMSGQSMRASYTVLIEDVPAGVFTMSGNTIIAADGADGPDGANGLDAVSLIAAPSGEQGGPGVEKTVSCDSSSHGAGGTPGTNSGVSPSTRDMNGGAGGAGGEMDTECSIFNSNYAATAGDPGTPAGYFSGTTGAPGAGGPANSSTPGGPGLPGIVVNGSAGAGGGTATASGGFLLNELWFAAPGTNGGTGENGSGGGGGGGSGGDDNGTDAWGGGGGGGGAGGLAARGGGTGGIGGGGSFGIYIIDSSPAITNNSIEMGSGGDGGNGGDGGSGQPGGTGGLPGLFPGTLSPGVGGDGAHGGHGGGGGGGAGGASWGIYSVGVSTPLTSNNTFTGGSSGSAGNGGLSAPIFQSTIYDDGNDGGAGIPGLSAPTGSCASAAAC